MRSFTDAKSISMLDANNGEGNQYSFDVGQSTSTADRAHGTEERCSGEQQLAAGGA
jgi:hypothetical protein